MRLVRMVTGMLVLALMLSACYRDSNSSTVVKGSGNVTTETRPVSEFTAVTLASVGDMDIQVTGTESLTIEAEDNLLPLLKTDVSNSRLTIRTDDKVDIFPTKPIKYRLTVKSLNQIDLTGAGNITGGEFQGGTLRVNLTGAGNITPAGQVDNLELVVSGAGNFAGENLACKNATVYVRGIGNATVKVSDKLDAHVSGVGSIIYIGDPRVTKEVTGVGSITQQGGGTK